MNIKQLVVAATVVIAAGSAFADTVSASGTSVASPKTRAEVQAELVKARADGSMDYTDANYPILPKTKSTLTRAEVQAELVKARADGSMDYTDANYPILPKTKSTLTRAEVQAELVTDRQHSLISYSDSQYPRP